ncbi:MAG: ATP-dependent DNA helicase [Anaerolineaceae bacterium]|jgi:DNA helicase-2/ATP-dependent DNA helicase PcrA
MTNTYLDDLSSEQKKPFEKKSQNAVILAAAGSGKTRTLTHLLLDDLAKGIPATGIIAFTFTEKAADELLARIYKLALQYLPDVNRTGIFIGTIHSWCFQYLNNQSEFYNFTPIDELQVDAFVSRFYDHLGIEKAYNLPYPRGISSFLADVEVFYNEDLEFDKVPDNVKLSIQTYIELLRSNRLMTFGDMVRSARDHLNKSNGLPQLVSLYVDEYQDVNPAQVNLIKAMASDKTRLTVVGDDLQCIYNWRGSDVSRILHFSNDFTDSSTFRLSDNYRSRPGIVHVANQVALDVSQRDTSKYINPKRQSSGKQEYFWLSTDDETEQAQLITDIVCNLIENGVPEKKIAILLRSVNKYGKPIVQSLSKKVKVYSPLISRGGDFIDDFLLPLFNWLRSETKEPTNKLEEDLLERKNTDLWDHAKNWISPNISRPEQTFWECASYWHKLIEQSHNDAYDIRGRLYDLLKACQIVISPDDINLMVGLGISSQIIRSVEEIHRRRITGHQRRTAEGLMNEVFFALNRNKEDFGDSMPIDIDMTEGVLVSTVHQAKGLEWPVVIIPMLVDKRFPHTDTNNGTSFPDEIAGRYGTNLDDERRLFYVAVTRAKERLFLIDPSNQKPKRASRFIKDLIAKEVITKQSLARINRNVFTIDPSDLKNDIKPPLRIGLSDLLIYMECPFEYGLRRIVSIQPSVGEELGFGKGLHELIQRHYEDKPVWSEAELHQQVEANVILPLMSENGEKKSRRAIKDRIGQLEKLGVFDAKVETEVQVEVLLTNGVIHGIIDLIISKPDGTLFLRDWKSNIHENLFPRYERQLQFYYYALKSQQKNICGADIVDIQQTAKRGSLVTYEIDVSQLTIDKLIIGVEEALDGIVNGLFPINPNEKNCSCCDMARICRNWTDS